MQEHGLMNTIVKGSNQHGFTIIEVMIAVTVFAIGILAVAAMQIGAVNGNTAAGTLTDATMIAQNRMEQLMSLNYTNVSLNDTDGDGTAGLNDTAVPAGSDGSSQYTGSTSVRYNIFWNIAVNSPVTNSKQIRVIVQWRQKGRTRSVTLNSVKALSQ